MKRIFLTVITVCYFAFYGCAPFLQKEVARQPVTTSISLHQIQQDVEANTDEMVNFLSRMITYESVEDVGYELKPATKALMAYILDTAKEMGFKVRTAANGRVGIVEFGQGAQTVGVLAHIDVVPAPDDAADPWTYPPFAGTVSDGYVWGRGAEDDKGGVASVLYGAKILIDSHVTFKRQFRMILGSKEEKTFASIIEYLQEEPQPDFGFVPDAIYITQAEKGIADVDVSFAGLGGSRDAACRDEIVHWQGGTVPDTVPAFSFFIVKSENPQAARTELETLIRQVTQELASGKSSHFFGVEAPYAADLSLSSYQNFIDTYGYENIPRGDWVVFSKGKAVHAATPWVGKNAVVEVAFVGSLMEHIAENAYAHAFEFVAQKIGLSFDGSGLTNEKGEGIPFINPPDMPPAPKYLTTPLKYYGTSTNLGVVAVDRNNDALVLAIDFRTGLENTNAQILHHTQCSAGLFNGEAAYRPGVGSRYEAFYTPTEDPLLKLVVNTYKTLNPERPPYPQFLPLLITSAGTSYLKLVKNFVSFGPVDIYPDPAVNLYHQTNERISIERLKKNMAMYASALQEMLQTEALVYH